MSHWWETPQKSNIIPSEGQSQKQPTPLEITGDSEFLRTVDGKDGVAVWAIMDDLMDTVRVTAPRAYDNVMRRIKAIE